MAKKASPVKEAMTKTQILSEIAEDTELTKREVASVLESLETVINRHIKKGGVGYCTVPGLMKIKTVKKPARKAQKNVPNPFRPGEMMDIAAKPASTKVKVLPLKKLKDMV
ncbi:MAG: HU family DNA-binding protein [Bdellovibrionales bacterium]|nr:HU family DNA-binding protein [Bdellovibrionales bacterium]